MPRQKPIAGEPKKSKPRGRPFSKGYVPHNKRKSNPTLLDDSGHEICDKGRVIEPSSTLATVEPLNGAEGLEVYLTPEQVDTLNQTQEAKMEAPIEKEDAEKDATLTLIESVDFMRGNNKISLRLSKRHNRLFRLQIFLNDTMEIRPVTYNGASTAYSYWNVLKEIMK